MIIIKKTDNIFDIINKIKKYNTDKKSIVISFPFWHDVLYNKIDLKSIKQSTTKKIVIKTNDILSKKIWKQLWIKYNITDTDKLPLNKKDLIKYNYSFYEYFIYEIKFIFNKFLSLLFGNKKNIDPRKQFLKHYKQKSHLTIFIIILIITISIFSYIFLFALNKTYVYITPNIQVKTKAKNFIFDSSINRNNSSIELRPFEEEASLEKKISTTWIIQKDRHKARGVVIFYNKLKQEIKLLPKTRVERENWIIYETKSYINIPAAKEGKNWELIAWKKEADIIARVKDKYWKAIWERWNIVSENIILTIPWLEQWNRTKIFAKTSEKISSGKDIFEKVLSKDDLENAKKFFIESLKKQASKKLIKKINRNNDENNIKYKILWVDDIYKYSDINIKFPDIKPWEVLNEFKISWNIKIKTYGFNINSVTSELKKSIEKSLLPEKEKLLYINNKSITIFPEKWIIYRIEKPFKIKATLEIEYNIEYDFKREDDNYIKRLKQMIAWLKKEKAERILINERLISNATIRIRPFFVKNVSKYLNNIEFKTKK